MFAGLDTNLSATEQQHDASPETLPCSARIQKSRERSEELARLHLTAQKALPHHGPYGRSDDRAGREIREPMDGHGDAKADIERGGDRHTPQPPLFRKEPEKRDGHGERDGGIGGRPPPEDPAAQETKSEDMADIGA